MMPLTWGAPVPPPALSGSGSTGSHRMGVSQAIAAPQEWEVYVRLVSKTTCEAIGVWKTVDKRTQLKGTDLENG